MYSIAKVKKDVPNWSLATFKADAIQLYTEVCSSIADGDYASLRHKTTESVLTDIKRYVCDRLLWQAGPDRAGLRAGS